MDQDLISDKQEAREDGGSVELGDLERSHGVQGQSWFGGERGTDITLDRSNNVCMFLVDAQTVQVQLFTKTQTKRLQSLLTSM